MGRRWRTGGACPFPFVSSPGISAGVRPSERRGGETISRVDWIGKVVINYWGGKVAWQLLNKVKIEAASQATRGMLDFEQYTPVSD
uniref:Uncharacterized protein n=1 Tax=Caenorhabditis japonica TaxID=281687 RepID=A0A8R1IUM5_CAEJA